MASLVRIKKALESAARVHDIETVRALLTALSPYYVTEDILRQSSIGIVVGKLSGPVRNQARSLITQWKFDVLQRAAAPTADVQSPLPAQQQSPNPVPVTMSITTARSDVGPPQIVSPVSDAVHVSEPFVNHDLFTSLASTGSSAHRGGPFT